LRAPRGRNLSLVCSLGPSIYLFLSSVFLTAAGSRAQVLPKWHLYLLFGCAPLRPAAVSRPARLRGSHRPGPGLNERGSRRWAPARLRLARQPRGCPATGFLDFLGFCANRPAVARRRRAATQRCAACRSWSVVGAGGAWRAVRVARGTRGLLRRGHFRRDIARLARARWVAAAVRGVGGALLPSEVAVITFLPGCGASADPHGRRALRGGGCREARSRAAVFGTGEVVRRGPARHNHSRWGVCGLGRCRGWRCVRRP